MSVQESGKQLPQEFIFHEDPGHAWLEVPLDALDMLGISKSITSFSYKSRGKAYLEEDVDALTFIKAWLVSQRRPEDDFTYFKARCTTVYEHHSFIRNLPNYDSK